MKGLHLTVEAERRVEDTIEWVKQTRLQNWEKDRRDEDLRKLPEALSRFRDGGLLTTKTRKLLEEILAEDTRRKHAKKQNSITSKNGPT